MSKLKVGDPAPNFSLPDQTGKIVTLKDFQGNRCVVLYFYPKDHTSGCTLESCDFRDNYESFKDAGAQVIGISSDSVDSHHNFSLDYNLPFILLSDEGGKIREQYGVSSTFGLIPGRVTFVIDKVGIIRLIFSSQFKPRKHVPESLKVIQQIGNEKQEGSVHLL